jgi:hypothetical protein
MSRHRLLPAFALALVGATTAFAPPAHLKWPPWISVESPVNPFDPTARGALMLVHVSFREGPSQISDLQGSAEGTVDGVRRTVPLRFEETGRANTFALRRQWPTEGTWLVRLAVRQTTAIVSLDRAGNVTTVRVPTQRSGNDYLPRAVARAEIDSALAVAARQ